MSHLQTTSLHAGLPGSPSRFEEEDYEVDATAFFKAEIGNLANVKTMADALGEYGYSPEDRIERREICKIYGAVKHDMENEIKRLTKINAYVKAKALRARLVGIRKVCVYVRVWTYVLIYLV